jgi:uncharacterized protein with LGFP repeats
VRFTRPLKFLTASAIALTMAGTVGSTAANAASQSPIAQRYNSDHALAHMLGKPTDNEFSVAGGRERDYQWGSLYYSKSTGVHETHGAIWWKYKDIGGPRSFGFPTTDEYQVIENVHGEYITDGAANKFQKGEIFWNNGNNLTTWMDTSVSQLWGDQGFPYYGLPTGDEVSHHGYKEVSFTDNSDVYVTRTGTFAVIDGDADVMRHAMNGEYKNTGGASGYLGLPTDNRVYDGKGYIQTFQSGAIFADGQTGGAKAVHGAIYWAWQHDADQARLGYPIADEAAAPGGRVSQFENGSIYWNASTNATTITYNS